MTVKFGTDGWRAVISETFTFANLRLVAQAMADYVLEASDNFPSVVIGFDTRFLSDRYAAEVAVAVGLLNQSEFVDHVIETTLELTVGIDARRDHQ